MAQEEDVNKIEELKKSLYSRNSPDIKTRRRLRFSGMDTNVPKDWGDKIQEPVYTPLNTKYEDNTMSFLSKFLIGSIVFCILAFGIGAYIFFNGSNLISANNIDIKITGPVSVPGGEPVSFDIDVINNNNVDIDLVDMAISFPAGTTDPNNPSQELKTYRELLGDIKTGNSTQRTIKAIIFGEENLQKTITVNLSYKVKGSTSIFTKNKSYDVLINSSPISVNIDSYKEITSGQEFDLKIKVKSNSKEILKNVLLKADYPFGFSYISSDEKPLYGNSIWKLGDIGPGSEKTITIHGVIIGENSDVRAFRFSVGSQSFKDPRNIGTYFMNSEQDIAIKKPFVSGVISINSDDSSGDFATEPKQTQRIKFNWISNSATKIQNAVITAKLSGSAFNNASVYPDAGYYNSSTGQIVWNRQTNSNLASIDSGEEGTVSFAFTPRDTTMPSNYTINPFIDIVVSISGDRVDENNVPTTLKAIVTRKIRISSVVNLKAQVFRTVGPFQNTGPIPPKVDQETTYTIGLAVENTTNSISNTRVTTTLPPYVKWLDKVSPANENVTYDPNSGFLSWNVGSVGAKTGSVNRKRELYFQVGFVPSINQVNDTPMIINKLNIIGTDDFTGSQLTDEEDYLSTRFSTDPMYKSGSEVVVQ